MDKNNMFNILELEYAYRYFIFTMKSKRMKFNVDFKKEKLLCITGKLFIKVK